MAKQEEKALSNTELLVKMASWAVISLVISLIFFPEFWESLGTMLTLNFIFGQHQAAPWGVLGLCVLWLWLMSKQIKRDMELKSGLIFIPLGLGLVVAAIFLPSSHDYLVFQVLLAFLGGFIAFFGKGARIPAILLGIYGFVIAFPLAVARFVELPYSATAIKPLLWLLTALNYAFHNEGQLLHFSSNSGEPISVAITGACAGPTTTAVFLAIFALMMLDMPLPPRKAFWLLLFGVIGTWLQNIIRVIILVLIGYQWGKEALFTAHFWSIYILFPSWYLLFVYVYFRQVGKPRQVRVIK